MTWSELYFKKIIPAVLCGMILKTEGMGAEELVREQTQSSQAGDSEGLGSGGKEGKERIDGWERYCSGRKLTGFDNSKYKILHNSVYHPYLVLLEVAKICRPSVIDAKKSDFIPT